MSLLELLRAKREEIIETAAKHGATNVRVFGSAARGDDNPDSDVDILVDFEENRSLLDQAALLLDLEQLIEHKVDVATFHGLKIRIRDRVLQEAILL